MSFHLLVDVLVVFRDGYPVHGPCTVWPSVESINFSPFLWRRGMASSATLDYLTLLEKAVALVKTRPDLHDDLVEECRYWKGEVDELEVSCGSVFLSYFYGFIDGFSNSPCFVMPFVWSVRLIVDLLIRRTSTNFRLSRTSCETFSLVRMVLVW